MPIRERKKQRKKENWDSSPQILTPISLAGSIYSTDRMQLASMAERSFDVYTVLQYAHYTVASRFSIKLPSLHAEIKGPRPIHYTGTILYSDRVLTKASECGRNGDLFRVALYSGSAGFASRKRVRPPLKKYCALSLSPSLNTELL